MLLSLIVTVIIPLGTLFYCIKIKKVKVYLWGCLTFVLSQPLLRIPLLTFITNNFLFINQFQMQYPVIYILLVALSAGVFEEVGRYLVMKFVLKTNRSWNDGALFGLGHGEIEAFLLVGIPMLLSVFSGSSMDMTNSSLLLAGIERFFAILLHVGLSVLVMKAVRSNKIRYFVMAVVIHTVVDATVGIFPMFVSSSILLIEVVLAIVSMLLFVYVVSLRKGWDLS